MIYLFLCSFIDRLGNLRANKMFQTAAEAKGEYLDPLRQLLKVHITIDSKTCANYQNPSSNGSLDIVLTRFFYCYNGEGS